MHGGIGFYAIFNGTFWIAVVLALAAVRNRRRPPRATPASSWSMARDGADA
jgi:hypothetical protein